MLLARIETSNQTNQKLVWKIVTLGTLINFCNTNVQQSKLPPLE